MSTTKIVIKGRLSYSHIWEPHVIPDIPDSEPRYSCSIILNKKKDKAEIKKVLSAIKAAEELGITKCSKWNGIVPKNLKKHFWLDGDEREDMEKNPEYDGAIIIRCNSKDRPGIVDKDREEILDKNEVYSGCVVRVEVNFFPFDKGSKGISCALNHVQKWADGEPLSGRGNASDAFDDGEEPEEEEEEFDFG